MGDWGYGFLDSDSALDVVQWWNDCYRPKKGYDHSCMEGHFFKLWGDGVKHGDHHVDCQILALAVIEMQNGIALSKKLKTAVENAAGRELSDVMLETWARPDERRAALVDLLRRAGGRPKRPRSGAKFRDPLLEYASFEEAKAAMMRVVEQAKGSWWSAYFLYQSLALREPQPEKPVPMPRFLWSLERLLRSGVAEKSFPIYEQARIERAMAVAVLLGVSLEMSRNEIESLLDRCKNIKP